MCEILVKAIDHVHPDPDKDRRGAYKQGMPVVVMDDGHVWGAEEGLPKFWIIKLPGVPKEDFEPYVQPEMVGEDIYRRREYDFMLAGPIINQLNRDGEITLNVSGWEQGLRRISP
jgi:hypothetical protein